VRSGVLSRFGWINNFIRFEMKFRSRNGALRPSIEIIIWFLSEDFFIELARVRLRCGDRAASTGLKRDDGTSRVSRAGEEICSCVGIIL
jgi:hypothetical protein